MKKNQKNAAYEFNPELPSYDLQYHIVLLTKHDKGCINNEIGKRLKTELTNLIEQRDGAVISIETELNYVHILASLSPDYAISDEIEMFRTVTSEIIERDYKDYLKTLSWDGCLWAPNYLITSSDGFMVGFLKYFAKTNNLI